MFCSFKSPLVHPQILKAQHAKKKKKIVMVKSEIANTSDNYALAYADILTYVMLKKKNQICPKVCGGVKTKEQWMAEA